MKAVHFGAGNIGRGFVGLLLHEAGYEVVFADVATDLITALQHAESYRVHEVGTGARDWIVDGFRAINSATHEADVVAEIATADLVTTAVGPNVLRFVAPLIARALVARDPALPPLGVMACENAINATDVLREAVQAALVEAGDVGALSRGVFANTAVDRIVPAQELGNGLDVTVESYYEWAIESGPFGDAPPTIPGAHFVPDLAPYIERKLFTVNTGHATIAYFGFLAGATTIAEALANPEVAAKVRAVLAETKALVVAKHPISAEAQQEYIDTILERFANTALPDTVERVGRQPLRKLSKGERFLGPATQLVERGLPATALMEAVAAALQFRVSDDEQSVELTSKLATQSPREFAVDVYGVEESHPIFEDLVKVTGGVRK